MVAVQGPQAVHNPHGQIDQLQQSNPEINKLWCALQSQQKPQQDKKTSDGQSGFCWYHERFGAKATKCRDPCTFMNSSGNDLARRRTQPMRLAIHLFHKNSKHHFLVDTGFGISVHPANRVDRLNKSHVTLRAANNSFINTYRFKQLVLDFGLPRPLTWKFQFADVNRPVIGADVLLQHKLLVDLAQKRLVDTRNGTRVMAEASTDTLPFIQHVSINSSEKDPFTRLLEEFPTLTTPCTSDIPVKHGVTHHIRELKQATFLLTRTSSGGKPRRYRWRMMASAVPV